MLEQALRALLAGDLIGTLSEREGRRFARLKEHSADAKLKQVDIFDLPEDSLLIHLEKYEQPRTLFNGRLGERQRCDYVLITTVRGCPTVLFIEMKSAHLKRSDIVKQFKGAECILAYCDAALNRFHGQDGLLENCHKRYVVFYRPRLNKQRTRPRPSAFRNDSPEQALRYPAPRNPSVMALAGG